ncbi:MAG: hypothetical protein U9O94_03965 [Nanoarchaeota archaeon]|nr:hypothetical protein [Nanoarchaeota archaeon]
MAKKKSKWKERLYKFFVYFMVLISVVLVVVVFFGAYYFVIAPTMIQKPFVMKPALPSDALERVENGEQVIKQDHINYLINELGAYKLHKPFGKEDPPVIEFVITDIGQRYYTYVNKNEPVTKKGNPKKEDIIIKGSQKTIINILESNGITAAVKEAEQNGEIIVELKSDMKTLATKGYLSIYDNIK